MSEVWLFYPDRIEHATVAFRRRFAQLCGDRGWTFRSRPALFRRPAGRPLALVKPRDAAALYTRLHRTNVGVTAIGDCSVAIDPRHPHIREMALSLRQFVMYKGWWIGKFSEHLATGRGNEPWSGEETNWFAALAAWVPSGCENVTDPRLLPLHVFLGNGTRTGFESAEGRREFESKYGQPARRTDWRGLAWTRAKHYHGRDALAVGGLNLPRGFHWEATESRNRRTELITESEVWSVRRGGYLNVYPDAYVRGSGGAATKTWSPPGGDNRQD